MIKNNTVKTSSKRESLILAIFADASTQVITACKYLYWLRRMWPMWDTLRLNAAANKQRDGSFKIQFQEYFHAITVTS